MLEFWFNTNITRVQKFFILCATFLVTLTLYRYDPLPPPVILMFTGTGLVFLICRYLKQNFAKDQPTGLLYRLFTWIPIALLLALLFAKTMNNLLLWGVQGIAFMALAIFVFSPQYLIKASSMPSQRPDR